MEAVSYSIPSTKLQSLHIYTRATRIRSSKFTLRLRPPSISIKPYYSSKLLILHHHRLRCVAESTTNHHDHHHHNHSDRHRHDHHHHSHGIDSANLTGPQRAIIGFAKATRWMDLADILREHLHLCCFSTALFVAAAICPHTLPKHLIKPFQKSLISIAFPLVGVRNILSHHSFSLYVFRIVLHWKCVIVCVCVYQVSASLDALIEISSGKVNIHVLMAMAAFASIFMGNSLEGGLLLAMFNLAHIGNTFAEIYFTKSEAQGSVVRNEFDFLNWMVSAAEEYFTGRSMVDVKELKENNPDFALVLDTKDDKLPNTFDLVYRRVPVHDITVGSYVLVGAGEVCFGKFVASL